MANKIKQKWTFKKLYKNGMFPTHSFNLYAYWNEFMYQLYYTFQVSRETKKKEAVAKLEKQIKQDLERSAH